MSVDYSAVAGIGKWFATEAAAYAWFQANFKGTLSDAEREECDEEFRYFLENSEREDLPKLQCLNAFAGSPFALLYAFEEGPAEAFQAGLAQTLVHWRKNFSAEPLVVIEGRVW